MDTWLRAMLAMKSVLSLVDLDWESYVYLRTFCFPPLMKPLGGSLDQAVAADPCELDLDGSADTPRDEETLTEANCETFEFFGLGPLCRHPLLASYFIPGLQVDSCVTTEQALQMLMDYMTLSSQVQNNSIGRKANTFRTEDFIAYLCGELNISHVSEVGIFIQGDLRAERLALQHAVDNRYKLFVEVTKRELAQFNQSMYAHSGGDSTGRAAKKRRKARSSVDADDTGDAGAEDGAAVVDEDTGAAVGSDPEHSALTGEPDAADPSAGAVPDSYSLCVDSASMENVCAASDAPAAAAAVLDTSPIVKAATKSAPTAKAVASDSKFESKMKVYPSIAPGSALGTASASAAGDIYSVENAELQALLPFVANSTLGAGQGGGTSAGAGMDSREAGRWGEALVYQYLLAHSARGSAVQWLNQVEESRAAYDFIVTGPGAGAEESAIVSASSMHYAAADHPDRGLATSAGSSIGRARTEYIEVKTTRFADRNVFEISPNEWQFAAADRRVPYHVYRVFGAGDPGKVRLLVVRDVYTRVVEGTVKLCMAV
jgi:hypothetical protein